MRIPNKRRGRICLVKPQVWLNQSPSSLLSRLVITDKPRNPAAKERIGLSGKETASSTGGMAISANFSQLMPNQRTRINPKAAADTDVSNHLNEYTTCHRPPLSA